MLVTQVSCLVKRTLIIFPSPTSILDCHQSNLLWKFDYQGYELSGEWQSGPHRYMRRHKAGEFWRRFMISSCSWTIATVRNVLLADMFFIRRCWVVQSLTVWKKSVSHYFNTKTIFSCIWIPVIKIRRSHDCVIFIIGTPLLVRRHTYIDAAPCILIFAYQANHIGLLSPKNNPIIFPSLTSIPACHQSNLKRRLNYQGYQMSGDWQLGRQWYTKSWQIRLLFS